MNFTTVKDLSKKISEFRKDTKYLNIGVKTIQPIPKDKIYDFIMMTDSSLSSNVFSNEPANLSYVSAKTGILKAISDVYSSVPEGAFDITDQYNVLSARNRILSKLRNDIAFETMIFTHMLAIDSNVFNMMTGCLDGVIITGKYPCSKKLAHDILMLSKLEYLNIEIEIWDAEDEPSGEYSDKPLINGMSFHINNGSIVEVEPNGSSFVRNQLISDIFGEETLYELGMPLTELDKVCEYIKERVEKVNLDSYVSYLIGMNDLRNKG